MLACDNQNMLVKRNIAFAVLIKNSFNRLINLNIVRHIKNRTAVEIGSVISRQFVLVILDRRHKMLLYQLWNLFQSRVEICEDHTLRCQVSRQLLQNSMSSQLNKLEIII